MEIVLAYDRPDEVRALVKEYTEAIMSQGDDVRRCLSVQHLDDELADMNRKYALPYGRIYLALVDGRAAGCAVLFPNGNDSCEIKRLYVRPEFRGRHISRALAEKINEEAGKIGYRYMRLDTFPSMTAAIKLYESLGFYTIERYNENPAESAIFMQKDL